VLIAGGAEGMGAGWGSPVAYSATLPTLTCPQPELSCMDLGPGKPITLLIPTRLSHARSCPT